MLQQGFHLEATLVLPSWGLQTGQLKQHEREVQSEVALKPCLKVHTQETFETSM
jgi:hypothetical protein